MGISSDVNSSFALADWISQPVLLIAMLFMWCGGYVVVVEAMVALEGAGYVIKTGAKMKKRVEIRKAGVKVQR